MTWAFFWGTLAGILEVASLIARAIETRKAESVSGLSAGFLWFGLVINTAWTTYGATLRLPPVFFPSLLAILVFSYGLYRIHRSHRPQLQPLLLATLISVLLIAAVLYKTDETMYLVGLVGAVSAFPQLVRIWRTHDTAGIAPKAWFITVLFSLVWFLYGITAGLLPLILANAVQLLMAGLILLGYWRSIQQHKNYNNKTT